jgi:hypothetical protein
MIINSKFDDSLYVDIIGEPNLLLSNCIFIATYSTDKIWYSTTFDRSAFLKELSEKKANWLFVIEKKQKKNYKFNNYIIVDNINIFVEELFCLVKQKYNVKTIAITGSVGKTTLTKALHKCIQNSQVIKTKRLTPLIIFDFFFNKIDDNMEYIIAELGLFYKNQIKTLSDLLHPYIGIITNIYDMHLYWNGIMDKLGLLEDKKDIFDRAVYKIMPERLYREFEKNFDHNDFFCLSKFDKENESFYEENNLFFSETTNDQIGLFLKIMEIIEGKHILNINLLIDQIKTTFKLRYIKRGNTAIFLDNHCSIAGYFQALAENYYEEKHLFIFSLNFAGEPYTSNIKKIIDTFNKYNKVFINRNLRRYFREKIKNDVKFLTIDHLKKEIYDYSIVIIHDPLNIFTLQ